jgi:hypothetical protein
LAVAYEKQKAELISLADSNLTLFNKIDGINKKAQFWEDQVNKQEAEIHKLQRRKKNNTIWLGAGVLAGLITGVVISN